MTQYHSNHHLLIGIDKMNGNLQEPTPEELKNLAELSLALGVSKKKSADELAPVKLAYYPYLTTSAVYSELQAVSQVWQKLVFKASRSDELIDRVYEQIKESDPMISQFMRIRALKKKASDNGLVFIRCDYFICETGEPKIIEYNLTSVSMSSHTENFQQAKRLSDIKNSHKYVKNQPNHHLAQEIHQLYVRNKLQGLLLMLVSPTETNVIEQRLLEVQLLYHGIKVVRMTLYDVGNHLKVDQEGNLRFGDETISVAYYRTGYQLSDYQQDPVVSWQARETIELSNAIKIPDINFDLINQKRMQVELSKEAVYTQYLSPQEVSLLKKSLVPVWEFDHMTEEQFADLSKSITENGKDYVLKPNLEGGGHNIYGQEAKQRLRKMSPEERKKYILMEKIITKPIENILLSGSQHIKAKCIYEVSQYGIIAISNNELLKSDSCGFLIRIKPENVNEGGIMAGVGSICSWMLEDAQ